MEYLLKIDNREKDIIKIFGNNDKSTINVEIINNEIVNNEEINESINKSINEKKNYELIYENLDIGDIQIIDNSTKEIIIIIERKTLSDLSASIKDGRYKEQKERMIHSLNKNIRKIVLIEGDNIDKFTLSQKTLESVIINTMIRDNIHIHLTKSIDETIIFIENIMKNIIKYYNELKDEIINNNQKEYDGEHTCKTSKKDNLTVKMCFRNMLSQITGISTSIAQVIVDKYETMELLLNELKNENGVNEIADLKHGLGQRRIGEKLSGKIYEYLTGNKYECLIKPDKKNRKSTDITNIKKEKVVKKMKKKSEINLDYYLDCMSDCNPDYIPEFKKDFNKDIQIKPNGNGKSLFN
jgi:crossover junction endonuclease MUS81